MFTAAIFTPLIGSIIAGLISLFGPGPEDEHKKHKTDQYAQWVTVGGLLIALACSVMIFFQVALGGQPVTIELFTWIRSGDFDASWALRFDTLTAVMLIVVNGVSTMVHIYSIGYMHHDKSVPRFMCYLSLFTFCMLMLVTADNLIQLFFGWEGVGLASYLLIGFWYKKPSACNAAIKAFLVNRVGDFGFALGIFATFMLFGTVEFDEIFAAVPDHAATTISLFGAEFHALTIICLLLFVGAMGKSAQLGLHTWLPDAMEGPTPVSALIHAATMVTAGVFMVARLSPMFEYSDTALAVVTVVGASTAFFAATIGCVQNDIKRVIAYSTCSQLGYMFFACGVSAYSAGVFHLMTHGFFKALLFLGAGSVIHAMSDEQDMRRMGGLWNKIPVTYAMFWVGTLAIIGFPFLSGYYSKEAILGSAFAANTGVGYFAYYMGIAAALMTTFYSFRLLYMTFHGTSRADEVTLAHVHESPPVMIVPLLPLALGACIAGYLGFDYFVGESTAQFWGDAIFVLPEHTALANSHDIPGWAVMLAKAVMIAGFVIATLFYLKGMTSMPAMLANTFKGVHTFLINKWYWDELYDFLFVKPSFYLGRGFWKAGDGQLIDGVGPDGAAAAVRNLAGKISKLQTGYLYHYAFVMMAGLVFLIFWYLMFGA